MTERNPYEVSQASRSEPRSDLPSEGSVGLISGQKMMIGALILYMVAAAVRSTIGVAPTGLLVLVALIIGVVGVVRLSRALGYGLGLQILCFVCLFVPLVNLLVILVLNRKATERLRQQGYVVGWLGAKRR